MSERLKQAARGGRFGFQLLLLALISSAASAANIYKCKGADGSITVSNTPCAKGAEPDAKLSTRVVHIPKVPDCVRIAETGSSLLSVRDQLSPPQRAAFDRERFGQQNGAGASRVLAELRQGALRVCAYFPTGQFEETVIEASGLVTISGLVDPAALAAEAAAAAAGASAGADASGAVMQCMQAISQCRGGLSELTPESERCISNLPNCGPTQVGSCCRSTCLAAYWKPPFDHEEGVMAMRASAECTR